MVFEKKDLLLDLENLAELIRQHHITVLNVPTAFFHALADAQLIASGLKKIIVGGEKLDREKTLRFLANHPGVEMHNTYGPTETTIVSASCIVDKDLLKKHHSIPIGRPINNTRIYILDNNLQLVPRNIAGELYIAGDGVSKGYINRPELTAEKFIDNPFEPGSVMYRTGDLGRWLDDGNIEYLGRIDTQIKIRGFRVELGEIESRLNTYKDIMDSVVVARGEAGDSHLVAFYVAQATQANKLITLDEQSLRAYLAEQLPEYMLPVAYVSLEHIPLTPNGKVDRRCLELQEVVITSSHSYVAASTDTEKQLVMLWAQVLKRDKDRIGIHDNFFELGGHSLMATQLLAKLRQQLGVNLPLKKLFDYPTIFRLAHAVDDDQTSGQVLPVIPVIDRHQLNRLPLSFAQERLWFIHQLDPNSGAYNIPGAIRLTGHFSLQELDLAFATLITRHEILRTVFPSCDGVVEQEIKPGSDFQIDFRDISDQPDVDLRESCTQELCEEEAARPFDLAVGPLMRCLVIKREDGDHVILLNMHHIISDGWSLDILIRELSEVLSARREEREARLAPLPIQYVDYCVWQREYLREGPELSRQMGYWTQQLANAPESLALPTDFPRPKEQSYKGATHAFTLDKQTTAALKALSDAQGCTLYMTVLAVANVLFYRYSGQSDICVGSPIANRQHAETESVMGLFVNTLVFRNHVNGEQPFVEFLQQVKEVCLQAYAHQDIPFEKLVEVLQPHRNPAINPLFQVMLAMRQANVFQAEPDLMEGESESYNISSSLSNFDLTIDFIETNDTLLGHIEYSSDLFKSETISRLTDHFQTLCRKLIEQPFQKIGATFFLSNGEKESLLKFGKGPEQLDQGVNQACLHDLFKEQVLRTPNATALEYRDEKISYQTLYDRSENLAYHLKSLGVGPDILVGILIDKCPNMIIGILGILQAGGAYLPLDSEYPAERLSYMVDDSHVSLIVSEKAKRESIAQIAPAIEQIICVDEYFEQFGGISAQAGFDDDDAERVVKPNNLAYVIYTSGSTGKPKGVEIEHASAVNHSMYIKDILGLTSEDRQLQVSNMGFDLFVEEVFVALNSGVTLVLSNRERVISFENLAELIELESISILNIPTAFFHAMVDERFAMKNVKKIIVGGEKLIHEKAYQFTSKYPDIVLINTYGPTEATVTSTTVVVDRLLLTQYPEVPIGRPIANTQLYILDDNLNYTPLGVPGDLYIGGKGLARGYLNRQDLTQTCFVDNPFLSGERMYKTGDIARWLEDGNIDYIGRADTQIKIRGFRVELGEVENRLQQFNEIKDSVVVVNKSAGRQVLVAFYVANSSKTSDLFIVDTDELQSFVAEVLPDYMVPVAYISLPSIPLTPNGKVDRKALSCYEVEIMPRELYQPASNETESALVEIWSELFQCDESAVGIRHNFFDLGGHSILAVQLAAKINKRFGAKFPLGELFSSSTIEKQAVFLERKITKPSQLLVEIQAGGQEVPIFLIPGAGGSVMFLRHLGLALGKNQPVYALQYEWSDNENVAIEALAKKYIAEIRRRKISSPYRLAGYSFGGAVAYEMANQLLQSNESVEELIVVDSIAPKYAKKYLKADDHSIVDELLQYVCGVFEISMSSIANNSEIINLADIKSLIIKHSVDQNMDLDGEQIDKLIQSFICDSKAYDKYDPAPVHEELRAVLFKATKNAIGAELPGDYGWGALLRRGIDIRDIHADHISILNSNHANTVAEAIFSWRKR
ncbi:non-ribosomal peptide synthetase [Teredinibacter turnerae]|uniref:non-ribosomal peptide synthetase n=1 Tax=Teredinibacter turnerae TaxID=2426 RepID=UPI001F08258C|nr:non-ribosomal peptide synthetase [Teredinibacter turnerae]